MDGKKTSSDGSYRYYRPDTPDTPMANIPTSKAEDDMKSKWVPPAVHGKHDYPSSVLHKGGYL